MKMFRLFTGMIALIMIALTGCSNQSPDFSPRLLTLTLVATPVAPNTSTGPNVAVGDKIQFTATGTCTTPPGSSTTSAPCDVTHVTWSVDNPAAGSITNTGLFTAGPGQGTVVVTGTSGDHSASSNLNATTTIIVGPPVLRSLVITTPSSPATIALASTQDYVVKGVYSDGVTRDLDPAVTPITWTSGTPTVATVTPTTGITTTATGVSQGTSVITASSPGVDSASSLLTVNGAVLTGLFQTTLDPATASVAVGSSANYQLIGTYSDGTHHPIPNSDIDWTVDDATIAQLTAVATDNKVSAKGLKVGTATIKGTLKAGVAPSVTDPSLRSATGTLAVFDAFCTTPLVAPTATTQTATSALCLLCSVANPNNAIDADPLSFASLNSTVGLGLLNSDVSLTVNSNAPAFPAGQSAGFIIGRPAGALLSAEVLSQLTISTLLNGTVQESLSSSAGGILPPLLRLTLLGMLGDSNTALLTITTTKPYDAIRVTFGTGVASALTTTEVFGACGTVDLTKLPAP